MPPVPGVSRALVPGAGSGYECAALAEAGWDVLGLDLAPTAVARAEALWEERQGRENLGEDNGKGRVTYKVGDFYELEGQFDLIFDYTFLCALPPDHRPHWAQKMRQLLTPQIGKELENFLPVLNRLFTLLFILYPPPPLFTLLRLLLHSHLPLRPACHAHLPRAR